MGKRIIFLAAVFFFNPNVGYTELIFDDHPLLSVPRDEAPYYAVGIVSRTENRPFIIQCTGTPITPTVVLTSAHCLYDIDAASWEPRLYFLPAMSVQEGVPIEAVEYIIPKEYAASNRAGERDVVREDSFDFGVIILDRALDDHLSSVFSVVFKHIPPTISRRFEWPRTKIIRKVPARDELPTESSDLRMLVGYTSRSYAPKPGQLHITFCPIAPFSNMDDDGLNRFFYAYRCSTTSAMSGGPIFYREGDKYKIQGIHIGTARRQRTNYGIYINYENYERIEKWADPKRGADSIEDISTTF